MNVNIALCYGGRQEVIDACRSLVGELLEQGVTADELAESIDTEGIARHLRRRPARPRPRHSHEWRITTVGISFVAVGVRRIRVR